MFCINKPYFVPTKKGYAFSLSCLKKVMCKRTGVIFSREACFKLIKMGFAVLTLKRSIPWVYLLRDTGYALTKRYEFSLVKASGEIRVIS